MHVCAFGRMVCVALFMFVVGFFIPGLVTSSDDFQVLGRFNRSFVLICDLHRLCKIEFDRSCRALDFMRAHHDFLEA